MKKDEVFFAQSHVWNLYDAETVYIANFSKKAIGETESVKKPQE